MSGPPNPKGELIERARTQNLGDLLFESTAQGPSHEPWFSTLITLQGREVGRGEGRSKRDAERAASQDALRRLSPAEQKADVPGVQAAPEPWPIYAELLAQVLIVAHERSESGAGQLSEVAQDAARLYRELLQELGVQPAAHNGQHDPDV